MAAPGESVALAAAHGHANSRGHATRRSIPHSEFRIPNSAPRQSAIRNPQSAIGRAFTLVELLVVVSIIAILLVIAALSWNTIIGARIEVNALNTIRGATAAARARAMELGSDVAVVFDHTGAAALYVHTPKGHAAFDPVLAAPDDPTGSNQFQRDEGIGIAPLDRDVRLAQLSLVDVLTAPNEAQRIVRPLHVAICFDPAGRLRVRRLDIVLPSAEDVQRAIQQGRLFNEAPTDAAIKLVSQRGCVAFRWSRAAAAGILPASGDTRGLRIRMEGPGLAVDQRVALANWLLLAGNEQNGATLVVNAWTGRAVPQVIGS